MGYTKLEVINKLKALEKILGRRPVKRDNSNLYSLSRKKFGSWNNMMKEAGYSCRAFQKPIIPNKTSDSLDYLLGLVCTDGHIQFLEKKGKYRAMIYTSEPEEVEIILKLIKLNFNYHASVRARKSILSDRPNYEVYASSKKICEFFHKQGIPYGAKSYDLRVPKRFFCCNPKEFWNYLRGVFDGDGSIIFSGSVWIFKISSGSEPFITDLNKVMQNNNFIKTHISQQKSNVWELKIYTKSDIMRIYDLFYKDAKFFYPRKKLKWESNMFKNQS